MSEQKLYVKIGNGVSNHRMTLAGARRYGARLMPADLKRAGFECFVSRSDCEIHGGLWFRVNYGKKI